MSLRGAPILLLEEIAAGQAPRGMQQAPPRQSQSFSGNIGAWWLRSSCQKHFSRLQDSSAGMLFTLALRGRATERLSGLY